MGSEPNVIDLYTQVLLVFLCLYPVALVLVALLWFYVANGRLNRKIASGDKSDGNESVANARRAELPEIDKE